MEENLFECGKCGEMTPFVQKKDKLQDGVQHNYAECQHCKAKATIFYTNKHIRSLLLRQCNTRPGKKKVELADKIQSEMKSLRAILERG